MVGPELPARTGRTDETMAITPTGKVGRREKPLIWQALTGALLMAFAVAMAGSSATAAKGTSASMGASAVPSPRPSPKRTEIAQASEDTGDAIGALISGSDSGEISASEDSDTPQVADPAPDVSAPPPPKGSGSKPINSVGLKLALKYLENNDAASAAVAAYALPDRTDIKIVDWLIATGSYSGVSSTSINQLRKKLVDWPGQSLMKLRYEQALAREKPPAATVINAFGDRKPASDDATLLLARAYVTVGRGDDAARLIRTFWREANFSEGIENAIVRDFSGFLKPADHKARMDRLLYAEDTADALRAAGRLDKNQQALAKAVILIIKESSKGAKALDALPASMKRDPLYTYSRIRVLRRADKVLEAGKLLATAPRDPKVIVSPDAWWVERRLVSRALIEKGNPQLAYQLAAEHSNETNTLRAEAEFHAGWYALEYLHSPSIASGHFAKIATVSSMPLSLSRAEYWLGRASAAAGDAKAAAEHFKRAAAYPTTFYGQLGFARLGGNRLPISQPPKATADLRASFADRELVQAIRHLSAVGYYDKATQIYRHLAETLTNPTEIMLLAQLAESSGKHQIALQVGKSAAVRGLPVEILAFPTAAIPSSAKTANVERPVVYAIARQESAFNPGAISPAGARGLLQLMPATAKETAKTIGVPYSKARLTSDAGYNAMLGAAHLGDLVENFGGSYVMTFAAYNAGSSRVADWVRSHGDPRDPRVDVVNWIELIPFTETRNYVQRIMENLQVYRTRLGSPTLAIEADLRRGGPH
jgi:soluble lytic murein transglycosylase